MLCQKARAVHEMRRHPFSAPASDLFYQLIPPHISLPSRLHRIGLSWVRRSEKLGLSGQVFIRKSGKEVEEPWQI
jgi:hypothetical protein